MRKLVVAVLLLVATAIFAQEQRYGATAGVTVIEVPVTVADRAGKPVRSLSKEQFEVSVDGKKVAITGFEIVDLAMIGDEESSTPLPPAAYRNFLLLFDLSHSSPGTIGRAQAAAKELVTNGLTRRDLAAVATHSVEQGLNVVTSFTSDKALLLEAVDTLGVPEYYKPADPLRLAAPTPGLQANPEAQGRARAAAIAVLEEQTEDKNMLAQVAEEENRRARVLRQVVQFGGVARLLDSQRGQKQVILLSEGFDAEIIEGQKAATQRQKDALERGEVWHVTSDEHFGSSGAVAEINEMAEIFRRSDVTMHAIDIKGLRSGVDASQGMKRISNNALYMLTRPTGGKVFDNATKLTESFSSLLEQQEVVYVVAFEMPRSLEPNRFHDIKVKVRAPGNPRVAHRVGFYEKSPFPSTPQQETLSLADVLVKDADVKDVALSIVAVALPSAEGDTRVPLVIELPGEKLLSEARQGTINAELFVYVFDEKNQIRDSLQQRLGLDVARHGAKLREGGLRYVTSLRLPPGKHVIKALVRIDETGQLGLARTTITVPAAGNAVFFGEPSSWINVAAPGRGDDAVAAFSADGRRFSPAAKPSLRADRAVNLAVYVDGNANREVRAAIVGTDGIAEPVSLPVVSSDGMKLVLEFKPPALAAGEYRLRITVGEARYDLPFRVE